MPMQEFLLDAKDLMALLRQMAGYLFSFVTGTKDLRLLQAGNAAALVKEGNVVVTDAAIFTIPGTDNMQQQFSSLVFATDEISGKGRYLTSGRQPTAGGQGVPLPTAGAIAEITGNDQIRKFQIIAETGNTLNLWYGLFQ
jgi:hypothetical protein